MKSRRLLAGTFLSKVIMAATMFLLMSSNNAFAGEEKVKVCHFPSGDKSKGHVISVSANAVPALVKKGDTTRFYNDVRNGTCYSWSFFRR